MIPLLLSGCTKSDQQTLVAKVGKEELHLTDLVFQKEGIQDEEWIAILKRWTDKQLLIQQAHSMNLHKSQYVKEKLKQLENELIVQMLLDSLIKIEQPSEQKLQQFYDATKELWMTKTIEVRGWVWRAPDQNTIQSLWRQTRTALSPAGGEPFDWTPVERLGPFKDELSRASIGIVTQPKKWGNEWLFVQLDNRRPAGYLKSLPEVRQELVGMYQLEQFNQKQDSLLNHLKQQAIRKKQFLQLSLTELINRKRDYEINLKYNAQKQEKKEKVDESYPDTSK